jgi:hypothetical protein
VGSFKADHKMKSNVTKMLMSLMGGRLSSWIAAVELLCNGDGWLDNSRSRLMRLPA